MKIMVTGASGLLGHAVAMAASTRHDVTAQYHRRAVSSRFFKTVGIDLTDRASALQALSIAAPDAVIHCAAMSDPVACERDGSAATAVNVDATRHIAEYCAERGTRLLFVSSDLVFDGKSGMYAETDPVSPCSRYGSTKVLAEEEVRRICANHVIARCCLMYGSSPSGTRAVNESLLQALREGRQVRLFTDEYRTPVCVPDLALALLRLAGSDFAGTVHCGGPDKISRYDFGAKICRAGRIDPAKLIPESIRDVRCEPPRAPDVSLNADKLRRLLAIRLAGVDDGLRMLYP